MSELKPIAVDGMDWVVMPNGCGLFVYETQVGSRQYWSDEIGGGVMVWDTALANEDTLLSAMLIEKKLQMLERIEVEREASK